MTNKKKIISLILVLCLLVALGVSYALWTTSDSQSDNNELTTDDCIDIVFEDKSSNITLTDTVPVLDKFGMQKAGYSFKITNNCTKNVSYDVNLESLSNVAEENRTNLNYVKVALIEKSSNETYAFNTLNNFDTTNSVLASGTAYDTRVILRDVLRPNKSVEYTLKMWMDESTPNSEQNKTYNSQITIYGTLTNSYNAVEYLTELAKTNTNEMYYDGASYTDPDTNELVVDNNLRYMGANPNNYVWFNNEPWRIIGVMNNVKGSSTDDGSGETRIKLIRAESLGEFPYIDSCADEYWTDNGDGTYTCSSKRYNNNWPNSTINSLLNDLYWNRKNHESYHGWVFKNGTWQDYLTEKIEFKKDGLRTSDKSLIGNAVYYLGGYTKQSENNYYDLNMNTSKWYEAERINQGNNNELTWIGNLGLMYPSDYSYASKYILSDDCKNISLYSWAESFNNKCKNNDWLYNSVFWEWTITPRADSNVSYAHQSGGYIRNSDYGTIASFSIHPVLYLKKNVEMASGDGSRTNPYRLTIEEGV